MASPALQTLIDASAGAAGSLFTCYLLYPLDLAKTQIQSGATKDVRSTLLQILREHGVLGLFEGLGPRALQTVLQNFIYFYAYAWLKQRHQQLGHQPTAVANTALGVLAGIANLTVPPPPETLLPTAHLLLPTTNYQLLTTTTCHVHTAGDAAAGDGGGAAADAAPGR